ncbi:SycD/LcrH family type III secretion system chaperone [Paraburkholderia agricolaris]|uniref:SycD/LcrH family type III secretion system chaperone n=1 Tax=Paraburkholderia agricolaris TaxID=2152888 RepID=UPI0012919957|nr:SycD/LcrH family type III secretion system chaperone [Paraburkholderia agricolaris]
MLPSFPDPQVEAIVKDVMQYIADGHTPATLRGLSASDYEAAYSVGHQMYEQGSYEDALQIFGFLMTLDYLDRRFALAFGACLQMLGRYEAALKYYVLCVTLDPNDYTPALHMAECFLQLGRPGDARNGLRAIVADYERRGVADPLADRARAMLELMPGEPEKTEIQ